MLAPNTLLNDRYRILEQVGEGGMATVYRGVDTRLGRTVALKVLHPEYSRDEPFLRRFQQEAEFAASLGAHPNIVDIYDIDEDGPLHYIVMAFVDGRSLKEMIEERAPFSVAEAFSIGSQVASALDFAHKRGLVHRDVKPQNILVTGDGMAKVTDFGIARSVSTSQLTRPGMVIGTVHYFSPEQAQGKPASPASDIYALGVILYEMLTGHLPFDAETPIGVAMQHVHSDPPSPWEYNPDLPARAVGTVMRALEKDPERRFRDAAELASALSAQATPDVGETTTFSPIPTASPRPQRTAMYQQVEAAPPQPVEFTVDEPVQPVRTRRLTPPNNMRTMWLALGAVLLVLAVALAAFFGTNYVLGGGKATATPTITPTPTPTPRPHRKKPTPTPLPVVIQPTTPPAPVLPTFTPTPLPLPTRAPAPPTPTPTPLPPPPTAAPPPTPTPTPLPPAPTPTPTAVG